MVSRPIKPTVTELGIDVGTLMWRRSGQDDEAVEVAFTAAFEERWVLMRLAGDAGGPIHVFDTDEWECFVDAAKHGEFDDIPQSAHHQNAHHQNAHHQSPHPQNAHHQNAHREAYAPSLQAARELEPGPAYL